MPTDAERDALLAHPGIRALLEAWPEAEVRVLGPIQPPSPPELQTELFDEESNAA